MTDPGWADATYLEPLDLAGVSDVLRRERPDALLPTLGGQTALNLAMELSQEGVLDELGIELIGASAQGHPHRRGPRGVRQAMAAVGLRVPRSVIAHTVEEARRALRRALAAGRHPAGVHARRARRRLRPRRAGPSSEVVARGVAESPIGQVLVEESVEGWGEFELEVIRDKHDNVVDRLLDREHRPDGRAHRRLGLRGPGDDPVRPRVPGAARRRGRRDPRGRRRDRRLERPVRAEPGDRRGRRHRDEPARLALVGAGLEGHRLPDRQGRHEAGRRLHARRDPERHHPHHAGVASSRRWTTWSSRRRASPSRSSPAPTRPSRRR